jgi:hypothetical protein
LFNHLFIHSLYYSLIPIHYLFMYLWCTYNFFISANVYNAERYSECPINTDKCNEFSSNKTFPLLQHSYVFRPTYRIIIRLSNEKSFDKGTYGYKVFTCFVFWRFYKFRKNKLSLFRTYRATCSTYKYVHYVYIIYIYIYIYSVVHKSFNTQWLEKLVEIFYIFPNTSWYFKINPCFANNLCKNLHFIF